MEPTSALGPRCSSAAAEATGTQSFLRELIFQSAAPSLLHPHQVCGGRRGARCALQGQACLSACFLFVLWAGPRFRRNLEATSPPNSALPSRGWGRGGEAGPRHGAWCKQHWLRSLRTRLLTPAWPLALQPRVADCICLGTLRARTLILLQEPQFPSL